MEAHEIIGQILTFSGLNPTKFAQKVGISKQIIYDLQRGKTKEISKSVAEGIVDAYPQINISFLRTGEGPMLVGGEEQKATVNGDNNTTINGHDITVPSASKIEQLYEARLQDKDALINALQDRVSHQREVIDSLTATLSTLKP